MCASADIADLAVLLEALTDPLQSQVERNRRDVQPSLRVVLVSRLHVATRGQADLAQLPDRLQLLLDALVDLRGAHVLEKLHDTQQLLLTLALDGGSDRLTELVVQPRSCE